MPTCHLGKKGPIESSYGSVSDVIRWFDSGFRGFFPPKKGSFLGQSVKKWFLSQLSNILMPTCNLGYKRTHRVQLRGSLMSYGGLTVVSMDFFLIKKGLFWDNQLRIGFLSQLSQILMQTWNLGNKGPVESNYGGLWCHTVVWHWFPWTFSS